MALEIVYDKKEDVPEAYVDLYTEVEGKWQLTGINDLATKADVDKLNKALGKERTDHKETKAKVAVWADMDQVKVVAELEELVELRAARDAGDPDGKGKADFEAKVNAAAEARINAAKVTSDRLNTEQVKTIEDLTTENTGHKKANTDRTIGDAVRKACVASKVIDTAVDDVMMFAERIFEINEDGLILVKDQVGHTPGIAADIWLSEMQEKRPHWWPTSTGGGSKGGGGSGPSFTKNPWSGEHWNLTEQSKAIREDRTKAERMAGAAGTSIGGVRPAVRKV